MIGLGMILIVGFFVLAFILYYFLEKNKEDKQKGRKAQLKVIEKGKTKSRT